MTLTIGSLFTGSGMLDVAVSHALDADVIWHCEPIDTVDHKTGKKSHNFAVDLLDARWPDVPNLGDITQVDWADVATTMPIDILCGGFPCTDVSVAGVRAGLVDGTRSGLSANMADAIAHLRPRYVIIENVRGLLSAKSNTPGMKAIDAVNTDLTLLGYGSKRIIMAAANIGAPHRRDRVFIVAEPSPSPVHEVLPALKWHETIALLPTPLAHHSGCSPEDHLRKKPGRSQVTDLAILAAAEWGNELLLPTPTARDYKNTGPADVNKTVGPPLSALPLLLPTPIAGDAKSTCNATATRHILPPTGIHAGETLTDVVRTLDLLPTPNASDGTAGKTSRSGDRIGEKLLGGIAKDAVSHLLPSPRGSDGRNGSPNQRGTGGDLMLPSLVVMVAAPEDSTLPPTHLLPTPAPPTARAAGSTATAASTSAPSPPPNPTNRDGPTGGSTRQPSTAGKHCYGPHRSPSNPTATAAHGSPRVSVSG